MDEEPFAFGSFRLIPAQRMLLEDGKRSVGRCFDLRSLERSVFSRVLYSVSCSDCICEQPLRPDKARGSHPNDHPANAPSRVTAGKNE